MEPTVSEMTVDQIRELISEVIDEKLRSLIDPDYGLELREDFVERLRKQDEAIKNGERLIPLEEVMANLGIDAAELVEDELQTSVS